MKEYYYIGGETYILRWGRGIHEVLKQGDPRPLYEGWYERCVAFLRDLEAQEIQARIS